VGRILAPGRMLESGQLHAFRSHERSAAPRPDSVSRWGPAFRGPPFPRSDYLEQTAYAVHAASFAVSVTVQAFEALG
jgi:hypothetical protein